MRESYWQKELSDKSSELGTDSMIRAHLASWTKGRQDITSVELYLNGKSIVVECESHNKTLANWKQLDRFIFNTSNGIHTRVGREIWCSPNKYRFLSIEETQEYRFARFNNRGGIEIPSNANFLVSSVWANGRLTHRWC